MSFIPEAIHIFVVEALLVSIIFVIIGIILSHSKNKRAKVVTFECGQRPFEWRSYRFPVQYFPYLLIYVAYAALAVIVFLSIVYLIEVPDSLPKVTIFLALLAFASAFASVNLRGLSQRP